MGLNSPAKVLTEQDDLRGQLAAGATVTVTMISESVDCPLVAHLDNMMMNSITVLI